MQTRILVGAALLAALAGCDAVEGLVAGKAERINKAYPLSDEVLLSRSRLFAALEQRDKAAHDHAQAQLEQMMEVRALACSGGAGIGYFDGAETIRRKIGPATCFREQDAKIAEWLGIRRLSEVARQPALVEAAELPPRASLAAPKEGFHELAIASAANVLVLRGGRRFHVIELPSGRVVSSFDGPAEARQFASLSPNGRILAVPVSNNALRLYETESGNLLWSSDRFTQVLAWLPGVHAALLAERGNNAPVLLDLSKGVTEPYPSPVSSAAWALPVPGQAGQLLVGSGISVALMEHERSGDAPPTVRLVRQWRLAGGGVTSGQPFTVANGARLLYVSGNDLGWLDLASGEQGLWPMRSIGGFAFTKLDERRVYLEATGGSGWQRTPRIFDTEKQTLVAAEPDAHEGLVMPLLPRAGYLRRGHGPVSLATVAVARGEEESLDKLAAEIELSRQIAKLEAPADPLQGGLRLPGVPPAQPVKPLLTGIPADAKVSIVGVYESANGTHGAGRPRKSGAVRVTVLPGRGPLVLVLASYEPVDWIVQDPGRRAATVLVSSYYPSTVGGTTAQVHRIGGGYAYKIESTEYENLKRQVGRYVAVPVTGFQGAYSGREFTVY